MAIDGYYLRSRDVAHILELSPDEVSQLAQTKKLKAKKAGRNWRFRLTDVRAFKRMLERERIATKLSPFA
jgi:excisionase family DNA binding protein